MGCRTGFTKRIVDACADVGAYNITVNWCGGHQLNLGVNKWLEVLITLSIFDLL